jgi:hypothetical protein
MALLLSEGVESEDLSPMADDELRDHRKKLETAINRALSDSPEVGEAIQHIRRHGYDIFLIIEATVGFCRHSDDGEVVERFPTRRLELTTQDERFLRSLKISPE